MINDTSVRGSLSDITVLNYLSGQGKGALLSTSSGGRYLVLATVNPNNGATCDVAGPLDAAMTLRDGECVVSVLGMPQDGMRTIQSRSCSDFCGLGASFDGQYVALSTIALQADHVGADGKMVYRPK
jgi:hypothetical protein